MPEQKEDFSKVFQNEVLKVFLLQHLSRQSGYPYGLLKAIKNKHIWVLHGLTKNDLYNTINSLEKKGFIRSKYVSKSARSQRHYLLTPKGKI